MLKTLFTVCISDIHNRSRIPTMHWVKITCVMCPLHAGGAVLMNSSVSNKKDNGHCRSWLEVFFSTQQHTQTYTHNSSFGKLACSHKRWEVMRSLWCWNHPEIHSHSLSPSRTNAPQLLSSLCLRAKKQNIPSIDYEKWSWSDDTRPQNLWWLAGASGPAGGPTACPNLGLHTPSESPWRHCLHTSSQGPWGVNCRGKLVLLHWYQTHFLNGPLPPRWVLTLGGWSFSGLSLIIRCFAVWEAGQMATHFSCLCENSVHF